MKGLKIKIFTCLFLATSMLSCTDLKEEVFSSLDANNFFRNEQEVLLSVGRIYVHMRTFNDHFGANGLDLSTTDETIIPLREGNMWWDNGEWIQLHQHEFNSRHRVIGSGWNFAFNGITMCNQILDQLENSSMTFETLPNLIAEVKVMRSYFYFKAMDWYGNVPLTTDFTDVSLPDQRPASEIYEFIHKELSENIPLLERTPSAGNYGRATQGMGYMLLAKLTLNAERWIGSPRWDETISALDQLFSIGYSMSDDYFANFAVHNESSPENIFVIPYDRIFVNDSKLIYHCWTLNALSRFTFDFSAGTWSGYAAMEDFYNLYDARDARINSWLEGLQYSSSGEPLMLNPNRQLNYTPYVKALYNPEDPALVDQGVRYKKYEYESGLLDNQSMSNDYVVFRLADAYLMKAEALMRKAGGPATAEAVSLVNVVRGRSFPDELYTASTLNFDELLDERGRELAWEGHRRQDLIRFGKWQDAWFEKPAKDDHVLLYPLPYFALDVNTKLHQNPGYSQ